MRTQLKTGDWADLAKVLAGTTYYDSEATCQGGEASNVGICDNQTWPACVGVAASVKWCDGTNCSTHLDDADQLIASGTGHNSPAFNVCASFNGSADGDGINSWPALFGGTQKLVYCPSDDPKAPYFSTACPTELSADTVAIAADFPNTPNGRTWTGQYKTNDTAYTVGFGSGGQIAQELNNQHYVRCVSGPALNGPATFLGDLSGTAPHNTPVSGTIEAADPNTGNGITTIGGSPVFGITSWEVEADPSNGSASISNLAFGPIHQRLVIWVRCFTVRFTDGAGNFESQVINITVEAAAPVNLAPTVENVTIDCVIGAGCYPEASASDPDNDTLTYSIIEQGVPGSTMTLPVPPKLIRTQAWSTMRQLATLFGTLAIPLNIKFLMARIPTTLISPLA